MSEQPISRRAVLGAAGVVAVGGVAGYAAGRNTDAADASSGSAYGGGGGAYGTPTGSAGDRPLAKLADIPDGGGVIVGDYVLIRSGSRVHAFSATCPHQGCRVNKISDGKIDCPCHGSVFNATNGAVVAGPAPSGLPPRPVTVRNGEVLG
jgi:Rieske Fe-S protein